MSTLDRSIPDKFAQYCSSSSLIIMAMNPFPILQKSSGAIMAFLSLFWPVHLPPGCILTQYGLEPRVQLIGPKRFDSRLAIDQNSNVRTANP